MSTRSRAVLIAGVLACSASLVRAQVTGACCVGSECSITGEGECSDLGGHFVPGAFVCVPSICGSGACCADGACVDDDGAGGLMDESLCNDLEGVYLGGAICDTSDPCGSYRIPNGYEVVEVSGSDALFHTPARMNNCGQIVFATVTIGAESDGEVFRYDNGQITRVTENDVLDTIPDINDHGAMVWKQGIPLVDPARIVRLDDDDLTVIAESAVGTINPSGPSINNLGHVVWKVFHTETSPAVSDVMFDDRDSTLEILADGAASQSPRLNNRDEIVWTRYVFNCPSDVFWKSDIMLYSGGVMTPLPSSRTQGQSPDINNVQTVTWGDFDLFEKWDQGETTILGDGHIPAINDRGDIAYQTWPHDHPLGLQRWEVWVYRDGVHRQISDPNDEFNHSRVDINNAGEMVWKRYSNEGLLPNQMLFMRRIRTGDVDLDNDVDLDDFGYFAKCYTGSIPTDRLCECRFLDIDHDRDVDSDDFALFMENYTGEPLDCHGHTLQDRFDMMLAGTLIDCNANGAPDDCDLTAGASQDVNANAIPDACDCPTLDTVGFEPLRRPKNRYLTVEPGNAGVSTAIRVTLTGVNGFEPFNGQTRWAGPPSSNPDENSSDAERTMTAAELQCDPHYHNWGDMGRIHLFGAEIVPDSTYDVQVVQQGCESIFTDRRNYSEAFTFRTGKWGDLVEPFSGSFDAGAQPDFTDIAAVVTKFTADPQSPDKARMQLQPNTPDPSQPITFSDIANVVDAFTGSPYPFAGPTECP